jgi:hypothetical protein
VDIGPPVAGGDGGGFGDLGMCFVTSERRVVGDLISRGNGGKSLDEALGASLNGGGRGGRKSSTWLKGGAGPTVHSSGRWQCHLWCDACGACRAEEQGAASGPTHAQHCVFLIDSNLN